ncbi:MAG: exonuclease domain-containing protein [Gammaproteobacteria bacterium]|nr:exonuclease domain-containing protein [Gammaproteobacteria bacterium]
MDRTFNAIDVETANNNRASICQIGIVHVENGVIVDTWKSYVNPEDWFDPWIVEIHGISEEMVAASPTIPELHKKLQDRLGEIPLVSHTAFDRVSLERAMQKYELNPLQVQWLDSATVARRTWKKFSKSGYGLRNLANELGIAFKHHDALEDARAAAQILLKAITESDIGISEWLKQTAQRTSTPRETMVYKKLSGKVDGNLYGETLVFTGSLAMKRSEAVQKASAAGCLVVSSVNTDVSVLVVGTQDKHKLKGMSKSSKHRKAEELIAEGYDIQIISESDFLNLISNDAV